MKEIILEVLGVITIAVTIALCRVSGQADKSLKHLERITLNGDKH